MNYTAPGQSFLVDNQLNSDACVQCGRCTASCVVGFVTAHSPRLIVRFLQWGRVEEAVRSPFLRLCRQCLACTVCCPNGVDVAGIMRDLSRHGFLFM